MLYSATDQRHAPITGTLLALTLAVLLSACDSAGYRPPPNLPLRKISVVETVITDQVVRRVVQDHIDQGAQYTKDIRRLELSAARTGDDPRIQTIEGIQQFRNLTYLDLRGQRLPSSEMEFIAGLVSLEELYLDGNRMDSAALERLTRLDRLRVISVRNNVIEEFSAFAAMQNLETLDLSFNERLRDDPRRLKETASLRRLVLQGTPRMDHRALEELVNARPGLEIIW